MSYNIVKKIYEILLKDKLITKSEYDKLIDKLRKEIHILSRANQNETNNHISGISNFKSII